MNSERWENSGGSDKKAVRVKAKEIEAKNEWCGNVCQGESCAPTENGGSRGRRGRVVLNSRDKDLPKRNQSRRRKITAQPLRREIW